MQPATRLLQLCSISTAVSRRQKTRTRSSRHDNDGAETASQRRKDELVEKKVGDAQHIISRSPSPRSPKPDYVRPHDRVAFLHPERVCEQDHAWLCPTRLSAAVESKRVENERVLFSTSPFHFEAKIQPGSSEGKIIILS